MTMPATMSPHPRKHLDPRSPEFEVRFAIRLRWLVDKRGWGPSDFHEQLSIAGLVVSLPAVKKWLNGSDVPRPHEMELIGELLGLRDYRYVLPPPRRKEGGDEWRPQ